MAVLEFRSTDAVDAELSLMRRPLDVLAEIGVTSSVATAAMVVLNLYPARQ